jgi:hypothetical protein
MTIQEVKDKDNSVKKKQEKSQEQDTIMEKVFMEKSRLIVKLITEATGDKTGADLSY